MIRDMAVKHTERGFLPAFSHLEMPQATGSNEEEGT